MGDQNNTTFHNSIKTRQAQNTMSEIRCQDGSSATTHLEIKTEAESYFSEILNRIPSNFMGATVYELRDLFDFECTTEDCSHLQADVTAEEIREVLFAMPSNKSPGPDGSHASLSKLAGQ